MRPSTSQSRSGTLALSAIFNSIRGCFSRTSATSLGVMTGHSVGVTPRITLPLGLAAEPRTSSSARCSSRRMREACSCSCWPASVSRMPRLSRTSSDTPSFSSRRCTWRLKAGWATFK
jgi:hypothetical protein